MSYDPSAPPPSFDSTIGVEILGLALALGVYGITVAQAVIYFRRNSKRLSPEVCFIWLLWLVDTVHVAISAYDVYWYTVIMHGDPTGFQVIPPWFFGTVIILSEMNSLMVRLGYAYRIWKLEGKKLIIPCIITAISLFLIVLGLDFATTILRIKSWEAGLTRRWMLYTAYGCQAGVDALIVVAMFFVLRRFKTGLKRLDSMIGTLVLYILNTGLLRTVGVILSIILFIAFPASFLFVALYFPLCKLYTCAFFGVLNAEQLLVRQNGGGYIDTSVSSTLPVLSTAVQIRPSLSDSQLWDECSP
ncbi:hypothetical protein BD413DRAFT_610661 [Trametes elegans]|nr:hypothetical protein BD413DRAFT_610661 [Trametes elegans]